MIEADCAICGMKGTAVARGYHASANHSYLPRVKAIEAAEIADTFTPIRPGGRDIGHECRRAIGETIEAAIADGFDVESSASRQHWIETGAFLPAAPYAVSIALNGGYMPSRIEHHATLSGALSDAREELDRAADSIAQMPADDIDDIDQSIVDEIEASIGVIEAALTRGDLSEFADGYVWEIARYEHLSLSPIQPIDFDDSEGC